MAGKKKPNNSVSSEMDWNEVDRALKLMAKHGLEEFEYSDGSLHVRLKKTSATIPAAPVETAPAVAPVESAAPAPAHAPAVPPAAQAPEENLHIVKSPIVGTFYGAPNPGAPPFVQVGDQVGSGQVLCIIEAMKLMNEIETDIAGEIARIMVESGQPVEYGEPLFAIRPGKPSRAA